MNAALSSYGVGVMIPFGNVGRLEINYAMGRKRFNFLFCSNLRVSSNKSFTVFHT